MHSETPSSSAPTPVTEDEASRERRMAELGLSNDSKRFLRRLHLAEKQLNRAFGQAHQGGDLEQQVSQIYHDMYGKD